MLWLWTDWFYDKINHPHIRVSSACVYTHDTDYVQNISKVGFFGQDAKNDEEI